jgi:hypoxanthine-DNA glycosylase
MPYIQGFPPICQEDAHTLILGSMPSRESLLQQRYYAHPRNSFWPIVCDLFGMVTPDYAQRTRLLKSEGVALWDVLKACFRSSSLDSDIDNSSIVTNDFESFLKKHHQIERVFFNGAKAESVYLRHVLPGLPTVHEHIKLQRLPSTSPANAGMTVAQKRQAWEAILK